MLRRNQVLDVLNHIQIELMRRAAELPGEGNGGSSDEAEAAAKEVVFATIAGIAAALQTSG